MDIYIAGINYKPISVLYSKREHYVWTYLSLSVSSSGIRYVSGLLSGLEIGYSHKIFYRLFTGLMYMNPTLILLVLCVQVVHGFSSLYYEYSALEQ